MQILIDKLVLFGLCLVTMSQNELNWFSIVTMLVALAVSSLCSYFENRPKALLCLGYTALCLLVPGSVVFLPLIAYDCSGFKVWALRLGWMAALPACFFIGGTQTPIAVVLTSGAAFVLQYRTDSQLLARSSFFELMDNSKESAELLERKNRALMDRQDYEVRLATLAERNRIAREIHDNVGHLLTRSLLQLSALQVSNVAGAELAGELGLLKTTLSDAMDSVRSSVHDLHGESVDLKDRLEAMTGGFTACPVSLRYTAGELPAEIKYCFTAIVREALSNIARHSDATEASITVTEHPAFCQLLITDNGTGKYGVSANGIGLQNMADRIDALGGIFRAGYDKGFRIFITVPVAQPDK